MTPEQTVTIRVDGELCRVPADVTVAAALWTLGWRAFRRSVQGEPRGPLCAMGVCFECRVTIDGVPHQRSCLLPVRSGMEVVRDE